MSSVQGRWWRRIALGLLGALVGLGLAEVIVRQLSPLTLGFELVDGRFVTPREFTLNRMRNSLGSYDVEHGAKRARVERVMLLGDSYVAGRAVETAQTIGRRLNHHLGAAYDVVALGQPGWGPREELTALRASGRMLEPDHVVLLFLPFNDVRNSSPVLHERVSGGRDLDHLRPGWTNLRPALLWFESSTLNQLVAHRLARFREGSPDFVPLDYLVYQDPPDAEWEAAWKEAEALLLAMRDVARELGASFLLVSASTPHGVLGREEGLQQLLAAYPAMEGRSWDLDLPNRQLADFAETNGIPFLSLEPTFREETRRGASLHFAYDGHWNAAGHDLAGRLVAGWLRRRSISRSG